MKLLVVAWDSGGGVEVVESVIRRCVQAGHDVRVLGTDGLRQRMEESGARFRTYQYAPDNDRRQPETDILKDWESRNALDAFARIRDRVMFGPASLFCRDVVEELERESADVVVVDILIASALCGAEKMGVPRVLLVHALYGIPRPGGTPMGAGFQPATSRLGRLRDRAVTGLTEGLLRTGLPPLNQARVELGLYPYDTPLQLFDLADRIVACTSPTYDFESATAPGNVVYVGPQPDTAPSADWDDPWSADTDTDTDTATDGPPPPLVLVGLSSTFMEQGTLLQDAATALGRLPVRGLITTGPTVNHQEITAPPNVIVRPWVRHADVLPHCAAVVTHGGHGTVMKALATGVPLVVVPMGRDQPDNAARVVHAGAGLKVDGKPTADRLEQALRTVLDDPSYRQGAQHMATQLADERDDQLVVRELEAVAEGAGPTVRRLVPSKPASSASTSANAVSSMTASSKGSSSRKISKRASRIKTGRADDQVAEAGVTLGLPEGLEHRFIDMSDGGRVEVVIRDGPGPTIVFLHGMGMTFETWVHQFNGLKGDLRLIAWNQRATADSTVGSEGLGLDRLVEDLLTVLEVIDVRRAVVVGHSLGGMIVLEAAIAHGNRLAERAGQLVLASTTGGMVPAATSGPIKAAILKALKPAEERWGVLSRAPGMLAISVRMSFGPKSPPKAERALVRRMLAAVPAGSTAELTELLTTYDARSRVGGVSLPVVVAAGARDNFLPLSHARRLATALPDAELVSFPKAGHVFMLEKPGAFNELLVRLVSAAPSGSNRGAEGR